MTAACYDATMLEPSSRQKKLEDKLNAYYFSLAINQIYNKSECRFSIRNLLTFLLIFALGVSYLWFVIESKIGISICLLIWNLLFFLEFYIKGNKNEFR